MIKAIRHAKQILTLEAAWRKQGRHLTSDDMSLIDDGAIVFDEDKILWIGRDTDLPNQYRSIPPIDCSELIVIPALVDCHTHTLFGGDRASEYCEKLNGVDYQTIAGRGGGILFSVEQTRNLTHHELFEIGVKRLDQYIRQGIGGIELKTGYGLSYNSELKILEVQQQLKTHFKSKLRIFSTLLAAHAIPADYKTSESYLTSVAIPLLNYAAQNNLIDAVDIFVEIGYFNLIDAQRLIDAASSLHIPIKIHADEFTDLSTAAFAAKNNCLSADHLLASSDDSLKSLADSNTIAVLLPGTAFFLGKPLARGRLLQDLGARVAIGSDYNPGSCHYSHLFKIAQMSQPSLKFNCTEMWASITLNASAALGWCDMGALVEDLQPQFSFFKAQSLNHLIYNWGCDFSVPRDQVL